jgi:hypothetical protein
MKESRRQICCGDKFFFHLNEPLSCIDQKFTFDEKLPQKQEMQKNK